MPERSGRISLVEKTSEFVLFWNAFRELYGLSNKRRTIEGGLK